MPDTASRPGWWSEIQRRARERDDERQVMYDRTRKAAVLTYLAARAGGRFPALLPEYLKVLLGSMIGFWLLAWPLSYFFGAQRSYTYAVLALVFSVQATYYKYQLAKNPEYRVRRCNCGGARKDGTETVLKSDASTTVGVPNSLLGAALYGLLLVSIHSGYAGTAQFVAAAGVLVSAYLAFVMIVRVGALCSTCINIAALNVLILWQLCVNTPAS